VIYPSFGVYHATKWGIEGFIETVAQEVAPFRIDCVIVEPGPTATKSNRARVGWSLRGRPQAESHRA
jgi:NAD(P)-dependent dehydrogenase (short-subunit alcohol dehydrogenase family)